MPAADDATLFGPVRAWLAGADPVLPAGCVLDVDLEAKSLLDRFLPTGRAAVVDAYRSLRAGLGRRPTPSEVLQAGYLPMTVSAEHGSWFGFVQAEGDLNAVEASVVDAFESWFRMLQTTALNKSYKMVVLRVLLDRDAIWSGMEIADLAAACRSFLENHPALRADLDGAGFKRAPDEPVAEREHFAAWWLDWPLSRWLDEQAGRRWFERKGHLFVAAMACRPEFREAFETLSGEMVDYRLAQYTKARLQEPRSSLDGSVAAAVRFRAKVRHSKRTPILFVPEVGKLPGRPTGPTTVRLPDGREWVFRFATVDCNVANPAGTQAVRGTNALPTLLREWFGPDAGVPGTGFEVEFWSQGDRWHVAPVVPAGASGHQAVVATRSSAVASSARPIPSEGPFPVVESPPAKARFATHVPVYDLTAAAGFWGPESVPEAIGWTEVPGVAVKPGMFVARVTGTSMEPLIPDGSWCLFRPCPAGSREGRIVLVQLGTEAAGENGGRFTVKKYHSELSTDLAVTADGWRHSSIQLLPVNPAFEPITLEPEDASDLTIVGEFSKLVMRS